MAECNIPMMQHDDHLEVIERLLFLLAEKEAELVEVYAGVKDATTAPKLGRAYPEARILVGGGTAGMRARLGSAIGFFGCQIRTTADAREMVESLCKTPYSLLLVDHTLPGVNRAAFLKLLTQCLNEVPIFLLVREGESAMVKELATAEGLQVTVFEMPTDLPQLLNEIGSRLSEAYPSAVNQGRAA